jgi:hypothetical protein
LLFTLVSPPFYLEKAFSLVIGCLVSEWTREN